MPNETPDFNLTPHDVDRILSDWQDERYHEELARRESAHESDAITERMFEESDKLKREREAQAAEKSKPVFKIPVLDASREGSVPKEVPAAPGVQPELPSELLPAAFDSKIPESAQPSVRAYLEDAGADWDRVSAQAQTTENGPDARARSKIKTEEDRSHKEILDISRRAHRQAASPAQQHHQRVKQANIKRRHGESGPSDKARGEI